MRTLPALALAAAVFTSCQCFTPVDEPDGGTEDAGTPDAGVSRDAGAEDAGTDAGVDAGQPDSGCLQADQCTAGPQPNTQWCQTSPDAGYSCIQSTCVWECPFTPAGRTCTVNQGTYCLECGDAGTSCPQTGNTCGAPLNAAAQVESDSTCTTWPGTSTPFTDVTLMRGASAQCRYLISGAGGALGELWKLEGGEYVAFLPGFGGWCTGRSAVTGAPRAIVNCPACQFVLMGFE
jgi:hypothetical protein